MLGELGFIKSGKVSRSHLVFAKGGKVLDVQYGVTPKISVEKAVEFCLEHKGEAAAVADGGDAAADAAAPGEQAAEAAAAVEAGEEQQEAAKGEAGQEEKAAEEAAMEAEPSAAAHKQEEEAAEKASDDADKPAEDTADKAAADAADAAADAGKEEAAEEVKEEAKEDEVSLQAGRGAGAAAAPGSVGSFLLSTAAAGTQRAARASTAHIATRFFSSWFHRL